MIKSMARLLDEADQEDYKEIARREAAIKVLQKEIEQIKKGVQNDTD